MLVPRLAARPAHLLEFAGAASPMQVTALEVDAARSERIHDTLQRTGLQAHAKVLVADAEPAPAMVAAGQWWSAV